MVFSTNQVRQFYVVGAGSKVSENRSDLTTLKDTKKANRVPGTTYLRKWSGWGQHEDPDTFEFVYVNAHGDLGHSDIIHRENIRKVKFTEAADLVMKLPTWEIERTYTPASDKTNDLDVYYINFSFPGFLNATDEEIETKTVAFKIEKEASWADAAVKAINLAFNAKQNLDNELLEVTKVTDNKIEIVAKEGGLWRQGTYNNKPNRIVIDNLTMEEFSDPTLTPLPLENNSRVKKYGEAKDVTATTTHVVKNGKMTSDLEWFCMGERGDYYRHVGWPNVIYTDYLVDPAKEYDYLDVHFYFQGEGIRDDKSEKLITLVEESGKGILQKFADALCGKSSTSGDGGSGNDDSGNAGGDEDVNDPQNP